MTPARRPRARRGDGDLLRDEILDATERLLVETADVDEVSVRAVASAVGVTAASIYRHFPDKETLIFQVCSRHFARVGEQIAAEVADADGPVEALAVAGRCYVRFAIEHPEYYRIMFMTRSEFAPPELFQQMYAGATDGEELPPDAAVFRGVMEVIAQGMGAGLIEQGDPYVVALHVWANVHGLAALMIAKPQLIWPESVDDLIDRHVAFSVRAVLAH